MITVNFGNRHLLTYYRTNQRVQWKYAEYAGRWASIEEAIASVRSRLEPGTPFEAQITDWDTDEVKIIKDVA